MDNVYNKMSQTEKEKKKRGGNGDGFFKMHNGHTTTCRTQASSQARV